MTAKKVANWLADWDVDAIDVSEMDDGVVGAVLYRGRLWQAIEFLPTEVYTPQLLSAANVLAMDAFERAAA